MNSQQLRFEPHQVIVTNVNLRREKHGEEKKLAVDLNVRMEIPPKLLDSLIFGMNESFENIFYSGEEHRVNSGFGPIKFTTEFEKYIIEANWSVDDGRAIKFSDVKLCKFVAEPKEGGLVELAFQIQIQPSPEQYIYLCNGFEYEHWELEVIGAAQSEMFDGDKPEPEEESNVTNIN